MRRRGLPVPAAGGRTWVAALLSGAVALVLVAALVATGAWSPFRDEPDAPAGGGAAAAGDVDPSRSFLDRYVLDDGRVSRVDQGGDTVSEGQAYAMLLAVATGDEERFDRVWSWTRANLQRSDGLLSWTWAEGRVTDPTSASDADLDTAHALAAAGDAFDRADLRTAGSALGRAVLDHETAATPLGRVLTAGVWADSQPWSVNPSYSSPLAVAYLAQRDGDPRWAELARGDRALVRALLEKSALPPDWAQVRSDGSVAAMPAPANASGGGQVQFGLDAARIPIRLGSSCDPADRALAGGLDDVLRRPAAEVRGSYDLGGGAVVPWQHPVTLVATAAAAASAGDPDEGQSLLSAADDLERRSPTYYGSAWSALGQVLLRQSSVLLPDGCDTPVLDGGVSVPAGVVRSTAVEPDLAPASVRIPSLGISSSLVELGIGPDGDMEVPARWQQAGWLSTGPEPGRRGPAVIAGHVDSTAGPAVFAELHRITPGQEVEVTRRDGRVLTFVVDDVRRYSKSAFPTAAVYGPSPGPVLRLITCGGRFDRSTGHYTDNIVVFASQRG